MYLKERLKNLIKEEEGNSLVEFALVLPMLIVLTVGGIYLSVSFGQKSILNGVNFMQARAGSVREDHEGMARKAKELYIKQAEGRQKWLEKAEITSQRVPGTASNGMTDFRVNLAKDAMKIDILINSLSILSGKKPDYRIKKIISTMTLPVEYVTHKTEGGFVSDHSKTYSVVNYETKSMLDDIVDKALKVLPPDTADLIKSNIFKKMVDSKKNANGFIDPEKGHKVLGTNPEENMVNIKKAYQDWGLDFRYNAGAGDVWKASEEPVGDEALDTIRPDKLIFLRAVGRHAKEIQAGTTALKAISAVLSVPLALNPAVSAVITTIKKASKGVEKIGDEIGKKAELNNRIIFRKNTIGGP